MLLFGACSGGSIKKEVEITTTPSTGKIYLYGEFHDVEKILEKELELWQDYYNNQNMRHLFLELPYYTAEFLNIWMKSDSDEILNGINDDTVGTNMHGENFLNFYKTIKENCPETVFHGTDVGHQYSSTGKQYREYLEENGMEDSEEYKLTLKNIEQGKYFYKNNDDIYRENKMVENFIREFDTLENMDIMGIYGALHTGIDELDFSGQIPCMANQLKKRYGENILSEDINNLIKEIININGKEYTATFCGNYDLTVFKDYKSREFWRLEDAYEDCKDFPTNGNVLPYDNYPINIEVGQVFKVVYTKTDDSTEICYFRSDGNEFENHPTTEEFILN